LVEGGAKLLNSFIESGLWDEAHVEISPAKISKGIPAPVIAKTPDKTDFFEENTILNYTNV
jgi:diaminohydroxyphosphoribosylaminopyrimidine deaminase/5-amino-6-(5-phosphoribosylamino)uracil reductase